MVNITIDQLIAEVRRLAAANPTAVYHRPEGQGICSYRNGLATDEKEVVCGQGCIFGQAFENLGAERPSDEDGSIRMVISNRRILSSHDKVSWCFKVQEMQDDENNWGDCIKLSDERGWILTASEN